MWSCRCRCRRKPRCSSCSGPPCGRSPRNGVPPAVPAARDRHRRCLGRPPRSRRRSRPAGTGLVSSSASRALAQYQQDGFFDEIVEVGQGIGDADRELLELRAGRHYADFFRKAVLNKKNIVVSGATGSGKTTFMKSLVHHIPDNERLVTIEDARELFIAQPNV